MSKLEELSAAAKAARDFFEQSVSPGDALPTAVQKERFGEYQRARDELEAFIMEHPCCKTNSA